MTRKASIGSVSSGTLRTEDLITTFVSELEYLECENDKLLKEASAVILLGHMGWTNIWDTEEASELVEELTNALGEYAPPYCYFGAHPHDGADFGFWPLMDAIEELPRISDSATDSSGEVISFEDQAISLGEDCVYVNDHGNVTVYGADGSILFDLV